MFGSSDSVFDFDPFEVGNWMTLGLMEEIEKDDENDQEEEDDECEHTMRSDSMTSWL